MGGDVISISVVIPTHNRIDLLTKHLKMFGDQTVPVHDFEVIVVADGCTDGTVAVVTCLEVPYNLILLESNPGTGASGARNRGAALASGGIVLFLDDDMEPSRNLLAAHIEAHRLTPGGVVLGHYPMQPPEERESLFTKSARLWWAEKFASRAAPTYRFSFWDFCTGNVSICKKAFERAGGFDQEINQKGAGEDYELGYRLICDRVPMQFAPAAASIHHTQVTWSNALSRSRQEGFGQALIVRKHPELFWQFNVAHLSRLSESSLFRPLWIALWKFPALGEPIASFARMVAYILLIMNVQSLFWRLHRILHGHAYWKGVRTAFGTLRSWERLAQEAPREPVGNREIDLDLSRDLSKLDELLLERWPTDSIRVFASGQPVGRIESWPGAEALRPQHVREHLVSRFSPVLLGEIVNSMTSSVPVSVPPALRFGKDLQSLDLPRGSGVPYSAFTDNKNEGPEQE